MTDTDVVTIQFVGDHFESTLDDGTVIGWDVCGNPSCGRHISNCTCSTPAEPLIVTRWRQNDSGLVTPVSSYTEALTVSARPRPARPLSIGDLVDDSVIAKVKGARK